MAKQSKPKAKKSALSIFMAESGEAKRIRAIRDEKDRLDPSRKLKRSKKLSRATSGTWAKKYPDREKLSKEMSRRRRLGIINDLKRLGLSQSK